MKLTPEQQTLVESLHYEAAKIAGSFCPRDDDAKSAAYIALCESILRYDPSRGASARTYALACVRRAVMNYRQESWGGGGFNGCRRKKSERLFLTNPERVVDKSNPYEEVELEDLLSVLAPSDREVFRRAVVEEIPVIVISKERGCSERTIFRILARCKERLRRELDGDSSSNTSGRM